MIRNKHLTTPILEEEPDYWGKALPTVEVTAPRRYTAGYDSLGNPIYTEDANLSMGYNPASSMSKKEFMGFTPGTYGHDIGNAAAMMIGAPMLSVATGPLAAEVIKPLATPLGQELMKNVLAGEIGARSVDVGSMALTGKTWGENMNDAIYSATGYNPQSSAWTSWIPEATNMGYGLSPTRLASAVETATNAAKQSSKFLASPLTGEWTTVGNRQYRLNPNTLSSNVIPIQSRPALSEGMRKAGWTIAKDGAYVDKNGQRFIRNAKGKLQSESSLNITNKVKKDIKASKLKAQAHTNKIKDIISKFEDEGIHGFSTDEWKSFRKGFNTTKADIEEYESHIPEYYRLFKELNNTGKLIKQDGKWMGLINGEMTPVNARQYIRASSENFQNNGWVYDGINRRTSMFPEIAPEIQNNGGFGYPNWTTNGVNQSSIFSQQRRNGPTLNGVVSTKSIPDRIVPTRYAHEANMGKYKGITDFEGPVGLIDQPDIKGTWRIFGPDMKIKAIDGNTGKYSNKINNPLSALIPPTLILGGNYLLDNE